MKKRKWPPGIRVVAGSWWIDYTYADRRVRRRIGPVESLKLEDVEKVRAVSIGDAVKEGEAIAPRDKRAVTLSDLKRLYLEALPAGSRRRKKAEAYLKHLTDTLGGELPVDRLSHVGLVAYRSRREKDRIQSTGAVIKAKRAKTVPPLVRPATVTRELSCLRAALSWAERSGVPIGKANVFRRLSRADRKSVFPAEPPIPPAVLSDADVVALCENLTPAYQRIVRFLYATGMRFGEAVGLEWPAVFDREAVPHVLLARTKAGKPRTVPLSHDARAVLKECPRTCDHVFTGKDGRAIQNVARAWLSARKAAGLPAARLHDLRHSFASHFVERGGDVAALRDICGWRDLTVPSRYVHSSPARALAILDGKVLGFPRQTTVKERDAESA